MSKHTVIISFPALHGFENVHRIRNFAEDLFGDFRRTGYAELEDMDSVTDEIRVFVTKSRFLGNVMSAVAVELKKHHLEDDSIVSKREGVHHSHAERSKK